MRPPEYLTETEAKAHSELMGWLGTASAEERHCLALNWNWDYGGVPLFWIVSQTGCAKETASFIFWAGAPESFLTARTLDEYRAGLAARGVDEIPGWAEVFVLLSTLVEKWSAGCYQLSGFEVREYEGAALPLDSPWRLPVEMNQGFEGKRIDCQAVAGFSTEFMKSTMLELGTLIDPRYIPAEVKSAQWPQG